jgi:hypothetical protein
VQDVPSGDVGVASYDPRTHEHPEGCDMNKTRWLSAAFVAVVLAVAAYAFVEGAPSASSTDCEWTTRAFGAAPYHVVVNDSSVATFQRLDTALRRAITEETADPRRDVQVRMALRVECPIPAPPPVDDVVGFWITDLAGVRTSFDVPIEMQEGDVLPLCAVTTYRDGRVVSSCDDTPEGAELRSAMAQQTGMRWYGGS